MQEVLSSVFTVSLFCVAAFLLDFLLPEGNMKKLARFACSLVLTLSVSLTVGGLLTGGALSAPDFTVQTFQAEAASAEGIQNAVRQYVRLYAGFERARVHAELADGRLVGVRIYFPDDDAADAAKRRFTQAQMQKTISVLYGLEENKIITQ